MHIRKKVRFFIDLCSVVTVTFLTGADDDGDLAFRQRWIINGAIGLQVIVGALTTGLSAAGIGVWSFSLPFNQGL